MRTALAVLGMFVFGVAALAVPALLFELREGRPLQAPTRQPPSPPSGTGGAPRSPLETLALGLREAVGVARQELAVGHRSQAMHALDAARRAAETGHQASDEATFSSVLHDIQRARKSEQNGRPEDAQRVLEGALATLDAASSRAWGPAKSPARLEKYDGGTIINAQGLRIGEVAGIQGQEVELILGGARDVAGIFDLSAGRRVRVRADELLFGPARYTGLTLVMVPSLEPAPELKASVR